MMKSINIFSNIGKSSIQQQRGAAMSPDELIRELNRRKEAERKAILRAASEKAERDKQLLREVLTEDGLLCITYVPFVIAEVAWDYADTVLNIAAMMRLRETKKLCRAIKDLRVEYDRKRFEVIDDNWRKSETVNMIMFQETLSKEYFGKIYRTFKERLSQTYSDLEDNSVMLIASVYCCKTVIAGLMRYCQAQEKVVSSILGYEINSIMPKQVSRLDTLVSAFIGDSPLKDIEPTIREFAEELAEYINDTEINEKNKQITKQQTIMTNEELFAEIKSVINGLLTNMEMNVNGNKAAGVRARKATLKLEKLMKQYRKQSVK